MSATQSGGSDTADIKMRIDIVQLIGNRVQLKRSGRNLMGLCPFHSEKTPSFSVSPEKQSFRCFGCGASGDIFEFVMRSEGIGFREALQQLAEQAGVKLSSSRPPNPKQKQEHDQMLQLLQKADQWYREQLSTPAAGRARQLIKARGLSEEVVQKFGLGYAPANGRKLLQYMGETDRELLHRCGLLGQNDRGYYDFFRDRLMFPIADKAGHTVAFCGRRLDAEKAAKYINSPESPVFVKGSTIYGLHHNLTGRVPDEFIVVEGQMDVIAMADSGWNHTVAVMGTAMSEQQAVQLFRLARENRILLCFDGDEAGQAAAWRSIEAIAPAIGEDCELKLVFMPDGEDPDSLLRSQGPEALRRCLAEAQLLSAYIAGRIDADSAPELRSSRLSKVIKVLRQLPDTPYRSMLVNEVAKQCQLEPAEIRKRMLSSRPKTSSGRPGGYRPGGGQQHTQAPPDGGGPPQYSSGDHFSALPPASPAEQQTRQHPPATGRTPEASLQSLLSCLMQDVSLAQQLEVPPLLTEAAKNSTPLKLALTAITRARAAAEQKQDWLRVQGAITGLMQKDSGAEQQWGHLLQQAEQLAEHGEKQSHQPAELLPQAQAAMDHLLRSQEGGEECMRQELMQRLESGQTLDTREETRLRKDLEKKKLHETLTEQEQQALQKLTPKRSAGKNR